MQTEIHYLAILANVDSSFLNLKLSGFEISSVGPSEMLDLVMKLTQEPDTSATMKLYSSYPCYNYEERCFFTLSRTYSDDLRINEYGGISAWGDGSAEHAKLVHEVVRPWIELLRLYAEGNLGIPLEFQYYVGSRGPHSFAAGISHGLRAGTLYRVDPNGLGQLTHFLAETKLPFKNPTLELARRYYDRSYEAVGEEMRFITLMTGMEVLFNRGRDQIRYTVSRYVAVLLGENAEDSVRIFKAIKKHYDVRSEIVHSGKSSGATNGAIQDLRGCLRNCIKTLYRLNLSKDEYCDKLDTLGFGQSSMTD